MREDAIAYYHEQAKNVHYEYFMRQVFPTMTSHVPGGLNYDMDKTLEERVDAWFEQNQIMTTWCDRLGIRYDGYKGDFITEAMTAYHTCRYSSSTELRKVRRQWKRVMAMLGWDHRDELWRRADGRDPNTWHFEWKMFRELVNVRYGVPETIRDVERCCD